MILVTLYFQWHRVTIIVHIELIEADLSHLFNCLNEAATQWFGIGVQLDILHSELEKIQHNVSLALRGDDAYFMQVLAKWLRSSKKSTVRSLQYALQKNDFQVLASGMLQHLNSSKITTHAW